MADPTKKNAVKRLSRDSSGKLHTVLVDLDTGQQVDSRDYGKYNVIDEFSREVEQVTGKKPIGATNKKETEATKPTESGAKGLLNQAVGDQGEFSGSPGSPSSTGAFSTGGFGTGFAGTPQVTSPQISTPSQNTPVSSPQASTGNQVGFVGRPSNPSTTPSTPSYSAPTASPSTPSTPTAPSSVPSTQSVGNISYSHPDRATASTWDQGLTEDAKSAARGIAANFGDISITSGYRDPHVNASVGGASKSQHTHGNAFDVSTKGMTDQQKADLVEMGIMNGATRVGAYSTPTAKDSIHFDFAKGWEDKIPAGMTAYPMFDKSINNMKNAPGWFTQGLTQTTVPTPTARPDPATIDAIADNINANTPAPDLGFAQQGPNFDVTPASDSLVSSYEAPTAGIQSMAPTTPDFASALSGYADTSKAASGMSPAALSNAGFGPQRSQEDLTALGQTLAGELGPKSLDALARGDPKALDELGNIVSVAENRAQSNVYNGSLLDALYADKQFSTWNDEKSRNTALSNYSKYGDVINNAVKGFYENQYTPSALNATHYANMNIANPSWAGLMTQVTPTGPHTFGSIPNEYQPYQGYFDSLNAYTQAQVDSINAGLNTNPFQGSFVSPSDFDGYTGMDNSIGSDYGVGDFGNTLGGFSDVGMSGSFGSDGGDFGDNSSGSYGGVAGTSSLGGPGSGSTDSMGGGWGMGSDSSNDGGYAGSESNGLGGGLGMSGGYMSEGGGFASDYGGGTSSSSSSSSSSGGGIGSDHSASSGGGWGGDTSNDSSEGGRGGIGHA